MKWMIAALLLGIAAAETSAEVKTFCNPINVDYAIRNVKDVWSRHGADPVIVLFKDRYYLFSTWDVPGCRVSDDLIHWKTISFAAGTGLAGHTYTAAGVAQVGDWLYYTELPKTGPSPLFRTKDPDSGKWEKVGDLPHYADPCLFINPPTGKAYMYHGLEKPIKGVQIDLEHAKEVDGTETQLMPAFVPFTKVVNGWEVCTWDNNEASPGMRGNKSFNPCREGSWMTFHDGKYYLQFASPGTTVPGYADGVLVGDNPLGPFTYSNQSPISQKDSGFITSAGHSCLFQDRYQNWWRAVTMLIGVHERFERRIGLFPAGFDREGVPYTRTDVGESPIVVPEGGRDQMGEVGSGWMVLSEGKGVTASSELEGHPAKLASDEDVRTWWSAKTGDKGEWMQVDLGKAYDVRALQVNLAEQDFKGPGGGDVNRFVVSASEDGKDWKVMLDESAHSSPSPHDYVQLEKGVRARFVKVVSEYSAGGGRFAVSDLRVFGVGEGARPGVVAGVRAERDKDRRKVVVTWGAVEGATGYLVRYGIETGKLYHHYRVRGGGTKELTMYSLNAEPPYYFRVDALNEAGVTESTEVVGVK